FGFAIRKGLENFSGDVVAIVMADGSDDAEDVMKFFRKLEEGFDSVFGSRFIKGGNAVNYPGFKLILNRLANLFIRLIFGIQYDDVTNAFKLYRRETIKGLMPLLSQGFNITVELPLKTITHGYTYAVLPNTWINREAGRSKFKLKKIGGHYLFIIFYCLIEKWFSIGNYNKKALNNMNYKGNSIQPLHSARRNK
ncbi:MAG: glycosyltransferase family 2 protein, partial [bacterium]